MAVNLDALQSAYRAAPGLDPNTHVAIANTATDPGDAATAAQATQAMGESVITANVLKQMDAADQNRFWNNASQQQQQMWTGGGYAGPPKQNTGRGFWSRALHDVVGAPAALANEASKIPGVGRASHDIFEGDLSPINAVVQSGKMVLDATQAAAQGVQHIYRAGEGIEHGLTSMNGGNLSTMPGALTPQEEKATGVNAAFGGFAKTVKALTSPDAWSKAWTMTGNGEKVFNGTEYNRIQEENQGKTVKAGTQVLPLMDVATAVATGTIDDYVKSHLNNDPTAIGDLNAAVHDNTDLQGVVSDLSNHKLSFGRSLVPDSMWKDDPGVASAISGAGDAIFDIKSDPTLNLGKARKAYQAARYGIKSADDVAKVMATPNGQRWVNRVSDNLSQGNYSAVLDDFPKMAPAMPDLARKGITTPEDIVKSMQLPTEDVTPENVTKWLQTNTTASRILIGDGTAAGKNAVMAPSLSWTNEQRLNAKSFLTSKIDWAKNVSFPDTGFAPSNVANAAVTKPLNLVGSFAHQALNLLPEAREFDPNSAEALTYVKRFSSVYLDKDAADTIVNRWASAGYSTADKRNIYMDMLGQVFKAGGIAESDDGQRIMQRYLNTSEMAFLKQSYAPGDISHMTEDGQTVAHGITEEQLTNKWSLPSYRDLVAATQQNILAKKVYGVSSNSLASMFNAMWKPAQLLRFGFPIRVSLDELGQGILRNGAWNTLQARIAKPVIESLKEYDGELDPAHKALADADGNTALSTFAANLTQRTKRGMATIAKPLISKDIYDGVKFGLDNGSLDKGVTEEISARNGGINLGQHDDTAMQLFKQGIKTHKIFFANGDDFRDYKPGNDLYTRIWKWRLQNLANSDAARHVLEHYSDDEPDLIRSTADFLQAPEWAGNWNRGARSQLLSDGRHVGLDATSDEAALDWASKLKDTIDASVTGADGTVHHDIIDMLKSKSAPELDHLDGIADEMRPATLSGPEQVPIAAGGVGAWLKDFTERGFDNIGKSIDWMARQPLFLHNYAAAHKELRPIIESSIGQGPATEQVLKELVMKRAIQNTAPFIHNPELRSQLNILTQNFVPFQFAQEQFYKRVTRTLIHSPEAIRKAQLATNAISTMGVTHDDGTGNKVFSYPLVGHAQQAVSTVLNALGYQNTVPLHGGFAGQLKSIVAGGETFAGDAGAFKPAVGPLVSLSTDVASRMFPELQPLKGQILGPIGASKSLWEQVAPATVARLIHLGIDQEQISNQYQSSMNKTIQDIIASKYDPKNPDALTAWFAELEAPDGRAKQQLIDQVKNGTRIDVAIRALLGFAAPAAPQMEIGNTVFAKRMTELQKQGLDFTTAMQEILRTDPSLTPYSVFQSQGAGKEPLPSTKASLDLLAKNEQFFRDNPQAAGFFLGLGQDPNDNRFNSEAYRLEMQYQMRTRKGPKQFLDDIIFNQAANDYFDTRDGYQKRVKGLIGPAKTAEDAKWAKFKQQYFNDNPQFAYMLTTQTAAPDRAQTLKALQTALNDPKAPNVNGISQLRDLVDTYQGYLDRQQKLSGRNGFAVDQARKQNKVAMTNFAKKWVADNPQTKAAYNTLMKTDLEGNA